jgi:hypothetical protein
MRKFEVGGTENGVGVPGVRDDDVVEGGMLLAEAGEPYAEDHCGMWRLMGRRGAWRLWWCRERNFLARG